ncbi:hypothetical protein AEYBE204_00025 [Asticcacaulis sp. YBE204]|nr:hypothetical protein AEYBE204_00025 [Asticcacaulis sp. YBE204]
MQFMNFMKIKLITLYKYLRRCKIPPAKSKAGLLQITSSIYRIDMHTICVHSFKLTPQFDIRYFMKIYRRTVRQVIQFRA